jgi:magnesium chelatase family protein
MKKNLARLYSGELDGVDARLIEVEADINVGLHAFNIVGLADKSLNEAKERVNSALKNSGVKPPNRENRKITINLAPADVKKNGSHYDLAIALGYLLATKQIKDFGTRDKIFLGELALDGRLRPVNGALNIAERAARAGFLYIFLPKRNANEAAVIKKIAIVAVETLDEVIGILEGRRPLLREPYPERLATTSDVPDFSEICGQENVKRALTIAAASRHNALLIGPPGVGKSFLVHAMAGIMPALTTEEAIDVTKIWSAAGLCPNGLIQERPFRAPHQTISPVALAVVGRSWNPRCPPKRLINLVDEG